MWPFATWSERHRRLRAQRGSVLVSTLALTGILALLVVVSLSYAQSGSNQTARDARGDVALAAADAGVNQYLSRMVEDDFYYWRYVDTTEDPRIASNGTVYCPGSAWTPGFNTTWSYPTTSAQITAAQARCGAGKSRTWTAVQGGTARFGAAEYSLRVTPPSDTGLNRVTVLSTGRVGGGVVTRAIQSQMQPNSLAEYQAISDSSISYGSTARTTGKIYSRVDVNHQGTALAPVYAGRYACSSGYTCGASSPRSSSVFRAGVFDSATSPRITDVITPPDFSTFSVDIADLKTAAQAAGNNVGYFNDNSARGWLLVFTSDGKVKVSKLTGSYDLGDSTGSIGTASTVTIPSAGAMYFEQSVVVSTSSQPSTVARRVSVGTPGNVYIGGNVSYANNESTLGLIAKNEVIIASYAPGTLSWRAATLAQTGQWRTDRSSGSSAYPSMTYTGSQAMADGGYASQYLSRTYQYDNYLLSVRPPYYPTLKGSWRTVYWREVTPPS